MVIDNNHHQPTHSAQQSLAGQVLQPLLARRRPDRILVMKHANAGDLSIDPVNSAQLIRLNTDELNPGALLQCRFDALPFEDECFDLVILHHLVHDGSEPFLNETLRVMSAGGDIVISGLNSSGFRSRIANRKRRLPALNLDKVCIFLKSNSFSIEQCLLMGLGGFSKPAPKAMWHGLGMPFADRVVFHGHHQSNIKNASVLRFKQVQQAGLASAALDSCSRKAAS